MIFTTIAELDNNLSDIVTMSDEDIDVKDEGKLREYGIDYLV